MEFEDFSLLTSEIPAYPPQADISEFFTEQLLSSNIAHDPSAQPTPTEYLESLTAGLAGDARAWRLIHICPSIFVHNPAFSQATISQLMELITVTLKTRSENVIHKNIPDRLYSSLKYVIEAKVSESLFSSNVVMMNLQVVDSKNPEQELLKSNSNEKLIKGVSEMTALSKTHHNFETKAKIQFTDVSYHHEKKQFAFKASFFEADKLQDGPKFIILSAPFCVYARRPTTTKEKKTTAPKQKNAKTSSIKRARKNEDSSGSSSDDDVKTPTLKKQKTTAAATTASTTTAPTAPAVSKPAQSQVFEDFVKCLNLLAAFKQSLPQEEREVAIKLVQDALFSTPSDQ